MSNSDPYANLLGSINKEVNVLNKQGIIAANAAAKAAENAKIAAKAAANANAAAKAAAKTPFLRMLPSNLKANIEQRRTMGGRRRTHRHKKSKKSHRKSHRKSKN